MSVCGFGLIQLAARWRPLPGRFFINLWKFFVPQKVDLAQVQRWGRPPDELNQQSHDMAPY